MPTTDAAPGVLSLAGLRRLLLARFVSVLGNGLGPVAVAFAVLERPGADARQLSIVLTAQAVAQVGTVLLGGVATDRFSRRRVLVVAELVAASGYAGFALLHLAGDAPLVLLALTAAVAGVGSALLLPALTRVVVDVVPRARLQQANAALRTGNQVAAVLGLLLAGVLVSWPGPTAALLSNAASYVVAAAVLAGLPRGQPRSAPSRTWLPELQDGARAFVGSPWLPPMVVAAAVINAMTAATFGVLGPSAAELDGGPMAWSLVLAGYTVGTFAALLSSLRIDAARPLLVCCAVTPLLVLPLVALGWGAPWLVIGGTAVLAGAAFSLFGVLWETSLQQFVDEDVLGRVSSFTYLVALALKPVGLLLAGALLAASDIGTAATILAGVALFAGLVPLLSPSVRSLSKEVVSR